MATANSTEKAFSNRWREGAEEILAQEKPVEMPEGFDQEQTNTNPTKEEYQKRAIDAGKFIAEMTPIIGDAMAAKEVYDEIQREDTNWFLVGALGGATILGLIPGVGDAAARLVKKGAKRAFDVSKRIEIDLNVLGSTGGNIKIKPEDIADVQAKKIQKILKKEKNVNDNFYMLHGGTDFDKIDLKASGLGEPGSFRPLGRGIYGSRIVDPKNIETIKNAYLQASKFAGHFGTSMTGNYAGFSHPLYKEAFKNVSLPIETTESLLKELQEKVPIEVTTEQVGKIHLFKVPRTKELKVYDFKKRKGIAQNTEDIEITYPREFSSRFTIASPKFGDSQVVLQPLGEVEEMAIHDTNIVERLTKLDLPEEFFETINKRKLRKNELNPNYPYDYIVDKKLENLKKEAQYIADRENLNPKTMEINIWKQFQDIDEDVENLVNQEDFLKEVQEDIAEGRRNISVPEDRLELGEDSTQLLGLDSGKRIPKRTVEYNQGGLTTDKQTQQAFNQGGYGVAGKFSSNTGVSAAKEKGNFKGVGYKGEAKEAPTGDPSKDKSESTITPAPFEKEQRDQYKKVSPETYSNLKFQQTNKDQPLGYMGQPTGQTLKQRQEEVKNVSLGETKDMAKARVKNSIFNKLSSLSKDNIFKDPKNISVRKTVEDSNIKSPLIQAVLESGYLVNDVGNLDTFDFNEQTGEYSFNRNKLISNLDENNPAHVKTINNFYLNATGAKTIEELDIDNPKDPWYWCSAFIHDILIKAGAKPLETYDSYDRARARKYAKYGTKIDGIENAQSGDILLIGDPETGKIKHLTIYIGQEIEGAFEPDTSLMIPNPFKSTTRVLGLGGNQEGRSYSGTFSAAEVNVKPFNVDEILGVRRIDKVTPEMKKQLAKDNPNYGGFIETTTPPLPKPKYIDFPGIVESSEMPLSRPNFNQGGVAMEQQMSLFQEGGMKDDGMDRDPVSGNDIPPGSLAKEVRDDIPAQLSEGEYVVPADVVQYYGVKFFEDLRMEAKRGLAEMDATGRIGGEPMSMTMIAIGGAEEKQKERQKKALGGIVGFDNGGVSKDMAEVQKYGSFNPYDFSVVGGTPFSPIARTGQSMGLTTPDTHSKTFYHPDGRIQAVPGRMVTVNGEQKFLPNPNYKQFTTGEWSETPPSQAKAQETQAPKEDRDDRDSSIMNAEAQRLQNENSLKVSADRLKIPVEIYSQLSIGKRFKLMGEEFKAMRGDEVDQNKINAILEDEDTGFDLSSVTKLLGGLVAGFTGNSLIAAGARILGGILSSDDDKEKKKPAKVTTTTTSSGAIEKSTTPLSRPNNLSGSDDDKPSFVQGMTTADKLSAKPKTKAETFREQERSRMQGTTGATKTVEDINKDMGFDVLNKGGLLNKPKRTPKKPRGKGLGSK